jgi:hypothetical protein
MTNQSKSNFPAWAKLTGDLAEITGLKQKQPHTARGDLSLHWRWLDTQVVQFRVEL